MLRFSCPFQSHNRPDATQVDLLAGDGDWGGELGRAGSSKPLFQALESAPQQCFCRLRMMGTALEPLLSSGGNVGTPPLPPLTPCSSALGFPGACVLANPGSTSLRYPDVTQPLSLTQGRWTCPSAVLTWNLPPGWNLVQDSNDWKHTFKMLTFCPSSPSSVLQPPCEEPALRPFFCDSNFGSLRSSEMGSGPSCPGARCQVSVLTLCFELAGTAPST